MSIGRCLVVLGVVVAANAAHAQTVNYTYDAKGRLTSAATVGGQTTTYSYDANGNRTQKVVGTGGGGGNTPPVANPDIIQLDVWPSGGGSAGVFPTTIIDPRVNDTDADGDTLTITAVSTPLNGTVTFNASTITYRYFQRVYPDGQMADLHDTDTFTYTISDGHGGTSTSSVDITIVVW